MHVILLLINHLFQGFNHKITFHTFTLITCSEQHISSTTQHLTFTQFITHHHVTSYNDHYTGTMQQIHFDSILYAMWYHVSDKNLLGAQEYMTISTTHQKVRFLSLGKIIGKPVRVTLFSENALTMWDQHRLKGALKTGCIFSQGLDSEESIRTSSS